jgi:hypothetical protein
MDLKRLPESRALKTRRSLEATATIVYRLGSPVGKGRSDGQYLLASSRKRISINAKVYLSVRPRRPAHQRKQYSVPNRAF